MELKKIKIIVRERTTKDGKKFNTFRAVKNDGKLIDVRFTREVLNVPDKTCYIMVDPSKMNISNAYEYPRLWVKEISEVISLENEEVSNINDIFG